MLWCLVVSSKSPPLFPVWLSPLAWPIGISPVLDEVAAFSPLLLLPWVVEVLVAPVPVPLQGEALLVSLAAHRVSGASKLVLGG